MLIVQIKLRRPAVRILAHRLRNCPLLGSAIANAQQDACRARIEITLDAEVNDPRARAF